MFTPPHKHPSFGYATLEEIEQLKTMGLCPDRDDLISIIKKRTRNMTVQEKAKEREKERQSRDEQNKIS